MHDKHYKLLFKILNKSSNRLVLVLSRIGYLACLSIVVSGTITSQCDTIYKRAQGEGTKLIFCVTVRSRPSFEKQKLLKRATSLRPVEGEVVAGTEQHRSIYSLIYISLEIFLPLSLSPKLFTTCRDSTARCYPGQD